LKIKSIDVNQLLLPIFQQMDEEQKPSFDRYIKYDRNNLSGHNKNRIIYAPNLAMRRIHQKLVSDLHRIRRPLPYAKGCMRNCSPIGHIAPHRHHQWFFITDIHSAYPSVNKEKLLDLIMSFKRNPTLNDEEYNRKFLEDFCLAKEGGLATGAPASPLLFNMYAGEFIDKALAKLCQKFNLTYTRYLDDLVFSGLEPIGKKKRKQILNIVRSAGFEVSYHKTFYYDLKQKPITLCGFGLEYGGRIFLPREYRQKIYHRIKEAITNHDHNFNKIAGFHGLLKLSLANHYKTGSETRILNLYRQYKLTKRKSTRQKNFLTRQPPIKFGGF